jgi:glycerol-1-phosphate dehydrogenase [NAD(P)+]
MSAELLQRLLDGRLADPENGSPVSVATRAVVIAPSLRGREAPLIQALDLGTRIALVADADTWPALGSRIAGALGSAYCVAPIILPAKPHADMDTVQRVRARSSHTDAFIAVGSGTINDLAKYAAHLDGKPYACFGTAPSMNGYVSPNAAIMDRGVKQSLPATAPRGAFLDVEVLCKAPKRMIVAGFGDSICRSTAQADWLLAHLLLDQPYRTLPFFLLEQDEQALLAAPEGLVAGDAAAMTLLARTLIMSGFGMAICGGSYPASQGEHLIAHYLEMRADPAWPESLHGEQIAVTTLTMARLQADILKRSDLVVHASTVTPEELADRFGPEAGPACWSAFGRKAFDADRATAVNQRLRAGWAEMRRAIRAVHRSPTVLESALRRAHAPTRPTDIGIPQAAYREAVLHAREIRDRFTFLDFAAETVGISAELPQGAEA